MSNMGKKAAKVMRTTLGSIIFYGALLVTPVIGGKVAIDLADFNETSSENTIESTNFTNVLEQKIESALEKRTELYTLRSQVSASRDLDDPEKIGEYSILRDAKEKELKSDSTDIAVAILRNQKLIETDYSGLENKFSALENYSSIDLSHVERNFNEAQKIVINSDGYSEMSPLTQAKKIGQTVESLADESAAKAGIWGLFG